MSDVQKSINLQSWDIEGLIDDISGRINPGLVARLIIEAEKSQTKNQFSNIQDLINESKVMHSILTLVCSSRR